MDNHINERRKQSFLSDLTALCVKHRVSLEVTDDKKPYGMHSAVIEVCMDSIIEDGEIVANFQSFEITGHINP